MRNSGGRPHLSSSRDRAMRKSLLRSRGEAPFSHSFDPKRSKMSSRPAEGLLDTLVRLRRNGVGCKGRLVLKGLGENRQEFLERGKVVPLYSSRDDRFDAMVARDKGRV